MSPLVGLVAAIAVAPAVYPQVDLTLRRQFKLRDRLTLWARADFLADRSSWRLSFNSEKPSAPGLLP